MNNRNIPYRPCLKCGRELYSNIEQSWSIIMCLCGVEYSREVIYDTDTGTWFSMFFEEGYSLEFCGIDKTEIVVTSRKEKD